MQISDVAAAAASERKKCRTIKQLKVDKNKLQEQQQEQVGETERQSREGEQKKKEVQ